MKKIGKLLALFAAGTLLFGSLLTSCSSDDGDDSIPVSVSAASTNIVVDDTTTVTANVDSPNFYSTDPNIATVDSDGKVTGVSVGTATIKTAKGLPWIDGSVDITVDYLTVTAYEIDDKPFELKKGGQTSFEATFGTAEKQKATTLKNIYSFTIGSDSYSIEVSDVGLVTGATKNGEKATVKLYLFITGDTTVAAGSTVQLKASDRGVTWTSSDTAVATVSGSGLVTGVAAGTATITASKEGYVSATITITVTAK